MNPRYLYVFLGSKMDSPREDRLRGRGLNVL